jgi:hypothetical protein
MPPKNVTSPARRMEQWKVTPLSLDRGRHPLPRRDLVEGHLIKAVKFCAASLAEVLFPVLVAVSSTSIGSSAGSPEALYASARCCRGSRPSSSPQKVPVPGSAAMPSMSVTSPARRKEQWEVTPLYLDRGRYPPPRRDLVGGHLLKAVNFCASSDMVSRDVGRGDCASVRQRDLFPLPPLADGDPLPPRGRLTHAVRRRLLRKGHTAKWEAACARWVAVASVIGCGVRFDSRLLLRCWRSAAL